MRPIIACAACIKSITLMNYFGRIHLLFQLLIMGVITGLMGAAPSLVWASGALFVAAFVVLIPIAVWIYTLVFAFSSLWFAHFALAALQALRAEPLNALVDDVLPASPASPHAAAKLGMDPNHPSTDVTDVEPRRAS